MVVLFVDLKATFDSVDRKFSNFISIREMRKREVRKE